MLACVVLVSCEDPLQDSIVKGAAISGAASAVSGGDVVEGAVVGGAVGALIEKTQ
jgi:hypothetical protein